jgi:benzodiazapine receptor
MNKFLTLLLSIAIAQSAGILGSVFTSPKVGTWYVELVKPAFNPPSWVFGPVWITLFNLMGIAAWLIWEKRKKKRAKKGLKLYAAQLLLNVLWSLLFFGMESPGLALAEIFILLLFIILTTISFWKIDKKAGALLIPYILWVAFAAFLNYNIWQLN